jgi:uncharacterized membrane protein
MTWIRRWLEKAENLEAVDPVSDQAQSLLRGRLADTPVEHVLGGRWLGHPVHPLAVQLPLGLWLSAAALDLTGSPTGARRLIGMGLLAVPASVASGAVDWSALGTRQRRVGVLHAALNTVAACCCLASYRSRTAGRLAAGRMWTVLGLAAMGAGGALGGHLAYAQAAGVQRWTGDPDQH